MRLIHHCATTQAFGRKNVRREQDEGGRGDDDGAAQYIGQIVKQRFVHMSCRAKSRHLYIKRI